MTDKEQVQIGVKMIAAIDEICHSLVYTDKAKHNPSMYANACTAIEGLAESFLLIRSAFTEK